MAELYSQKIMDHYHWPQNKTRLKKASLTFVGANHLCGDNLRIQLRLNTQGVVTAVGWQGQGCAISQAATSIFSELIKGKKISAVKRMPAKNLIRQLKINLSPTRLKCALLPLYTIQQIDLDNELTDTKLGIKN